MTVSTSYPAAPLQGAGNLPRWVQRVAEVVNNILRGKMNVCVDVTLRASHTTTTLEDPRIGISTAFIPTALNADGAAAIAAGIYVTNVTPPLGATPGQATINHASNAAVDQSIRFALIG